MSRHHISTALLDPRAIRDAVSLPDLVGRYVALTKDGPDFVACCPFHKDRTPSFRVYADGHFHCFGCGAGRNVIDFVMKAHSVGFREACAILGAEAPTMVPPSPRTHAPDPTDKADLIAAAADTWRQCGDLAGTLGERYLVEARGVPQSIAIRPHCLRWHDRKRMLVALLRDPVTDEPCGVHRTFLDAEGQKEKRRLKTGKEVARGMLGRAGVIKLSADEEVTTGLGVAEGLEDALHVLAAGWAPMWALGTAGAINRLPVLDGIEALTIFADADEVGMGAARGCGARWHAAGREVFICPPGGVHG